MITIPKDSKQLADIFFPLFLLSILVDLRRNYTLLEKIC